MGERPAAAPPASSLSLPPPRGALGARRTAMPLRNSCTRAGPPLFPRSRSETWGGLDDSDHPPDPSAHRGGAGSVARRSSGRRPAHERRPRKSHRCGMASPPAEEPAPCLSSDPVVSGRQGPVPLRHGRSGAARLSCADGHMSWPGRGAGDRDRTGMASLEGVGPRVASPLVSAESGACCAFHVPLRNMGTQNSGSPFCRRSSAAVRGAIATYAGPEKRVPCMPSPIRDVLGTGGSARWPTCMDAALLSLRGP